MIYLEEVKAKVNDETIVEESGTGAKNAPEDIHDGDKADEVPIEKVEAASDAEDSTEDSTEKEEDDLDEGSKDESESNIPNDKLKK